MRLGILLTLLLGFQLAMGQTEDQRIRSIEQVLDNYAQSDKRINAKIDLELAGSLSEVILGITSSTKLNIVLDQNFDQPIQANFNNVRVRDILLYLCTSYQLTIEVNGPILRVKPYVIPITPYEPDISYNAFNQLLTMNLKADTLSSVLKKVVELTGQNIIAKQSVRNNEVSGYYQRLEVEKALELLTASNGLLLDKTKDDYFEISSNLEPEPVVSRPNNNPANRRRNTNQAGGIRVTSGQDSLGRVLLNVDAFEAGVWDLIQRVADEAEVEYFIFESPKRLDPATFSAKLSPAEDPINQENNPNNNNRRRNNANQPDQRQASSIAEEEKISVKLTGLEFEEVLDFIMQQTNSTYRVEKGVYLIGSRSEEGLRASEFVQIQHRPIADLLTLIPPEITENVSISELPQLNGVLLSGSQPNIEEITYALEAMDRPIPNVTIELVILEVTRRSSVETGINAGTGTPPPNSGQTVFPALDFTFSADAVNNVLEFLDTRGIVNLGRVAPDFYLQLKAIEDMGRGRIHSRPQLSTLNAQEAIFKIGETQFFANEQSTITPGVTPIVQDFQIFEEINADFSITVTPVVSGDEFVTLDILFNQSDFIPPTQTDFPPGTASREFQSKIRIKDQELIVLGGLERKEETETGRGVPGLSRVPILKWFTSSKSKVRDRSELLVFIRPTILY